jgi:hypothetical protein
LRDRLHLKQRRRIDPEVKCSENDHYRADSPAKAHAAAARSHAPAIFDVGTAAAVSPAHILAVLIGGLPGRPGLYFPVASHYLKVAADVPMPMR